MNAIVVKNYGEANFQAVEDGVDVCLWKCDG